MDSSDGLARPSPASTLELARDQRPFAVVGERCGALLSRFVLQAGAARDDPAQAAAWPDPDDRFPEPAAAHPPQPAASFEPGDHEYFRLRAAALADLPGRGELRCFRRDSALWQHPGGWRLTRRVLLEAWSDDGIGVRAVLTSAELVTFLDTVLKEAGGAALAGLPPASASSAGIQLGAGRRPARRQRERVPDGFARPRVPALRAQARSVPVAVGDPAARRGDVRR